MEPITQLLFSSVTFHFSQHLKYFFHKCRLKKIFLYILHTWDVAEETEGDGDAGGVSRLQGKFKVT